MIKEAELTNQKTGITYLRGGTATYPGTVFGTVNLLNPTFSLIGTGEDTRPKPDIQPEFSQSLVPYKLLSTTTGAELHETSALLLLLVLLAAVSENSITDYHTTFEVKSSLPKHLYTTSIEEQAAAAEVNTASIQAEHLRQISGLKVERLAEIFGVSRTTYYKWIAGSQIHNEHREHLLEVLTLVKEANQRLGGPSVTNTWLLTPVSPGGKKPIDYLATREYPIFRGFLLRVRNGQETFRPLTPTKRVHIERSREEFEDALERLRPRAWIDDESNNDTDLSVADNEET